jgi:DNA-binding transcriptional ArsR family regulator
MAEQELREDVFRLHARICSGLADPNRILILYTLSEHPHNVTELAESLELPQPTVSRHLKILRERGMVSAHREGQSVFYALADRRIIEALNLLRAMMADQLKGQIELARTVDEEMES